MFPSQIPFSDLPSFNRGEKLLDSFISLVCAISDDKRAELEKDVDLIIASPDYCKALAAKSALAAQLVQKQIMLVSEVLVIDTLPATELMAA